MLSWNFNAKNDELLESTKSKISKYRNGENAPHSEITEVVIIHCNIVNIDYQQYSRAIYKFIPNKSLLINY